MNFAGILLAVFSGACNGLFTAPMKLQSRWKWENTWLVFIIVACWLMPPIILLPNFASLGRVFAIAPPGAIAAALGFGFAWGFGAISFGQSVNSLGVSIANSLVIGISSALGSLVPLILGHNLNMSSRIVTLLSGVAAFLVGVALCGAAGMMRDKSAAASTGKGVEIRGYLFAIAAGVMSAIFNIGFTRALPIADAAKSLGFSEFAAANCIWLLMLGAGALPNIGYCLYLAKRNKTAPLLTASGAGHAAVLAVVMGLLWGGSIFLYGAAVTKLGDIGPSVGWPLSLAVGLVVANAMGLLLREWNTAPKAAITRMQWGLAVLIVAILLCAASTRIAA